MPYVTRGTIQLVDTENPANDRILINPADDYSVKHGNDRYCVFIDPAPAPAPAVVGAAIYHSGHEFQFVPGLKDSLRTAAFERTLLDLIVDPAAPSTITKIKIPATP